MPQLTFKWPAQTSYATEDFIVSGSNADAATFLDSWPDTHNTHAAILSGPPSSGKTHLAKQWAKRVKAHTIDKSAVGTIPSAELWRDGRYAALEDIHTITDETALFHLLRHAESHGLFLLMTSRTTAKQMPCTLPDLQSRLLAAAACQLQAPDETLLHAFLTKSFSDRQLRVADDVITYLTKRIERSFVHALAAIDRIEAASLETKREVTIPLVKPLIENP